MTFALDEALIDFFVPAVVGALVNKLWPHNLIVALPAVCKTLASLVDSWLEVELFAFFRVFVGLLLLPFVLDLIPVVHQPHFGVHLGVHGPRGVTSGLEQVLHGWIEQLPLGYHHL